MVAKTKSFKGHGTYRLYNVYPFRKQALSIAANLRAYEKGARVVTVTVRGKKQWAVYHKE